MNNYIEMIKKKYHYTKYNDYIYVHIYNELSRYKLSKRFYKDRYGYRYETEYYYTYIDSKSDFEKISIPILNVLLKYKNYILKIDTNFYSQFFECKKKFINIIKNLNDNYKLEILDKIENTQYIYFLDNLSWFIDGICDIYTRYKVKFDIKLDYLNKINMYDFKHLITENIEMKYILIKLLNYNELIINNHIINDKTKELEEISKKYDIFDEYIYLINYLLLRMIIN